MDISSALRETIASGMIEEVLIFEQKNRGMVVFNGWGNEDGVFISY